MADFLQSPILPGQSLPTHEHRRMLWLLLIVVFLAVLICLGFLLGYFDQKLNFEPTGSVSTDVTTPEQKIAEDLAKSAIYLDEKTKSDIAVSLKKSAIVLTDKQKADIATQLAK